MPGKRPTVPGEDFGRRPTALEKLTGGADANRDTAPPNNGTTVRPPDGDTASPQSGGTVAPLEGDAASRSHHTTAAPAGAGTTLAPRHKAGKAGGEKTTFYLHADQPNVTLLPSARARPRTGQSSH